MGRIVIVAYRPKPGREADLHALTLDHVPALRQLGLATDRAPAAMLTADGTVVEMFEWTDDGIARAHEHPEVQAMWGRYAEVCDYVPLNTLPEATMLFAEFTPIEIP